MCNGQNMSQWDIDQNTELLFRLCNLLCLEAFVPGLSVHETKCLSEVSSYSQILYCIGGAHLLVMNLRKEQHVRPVNGCGARVVCTPSTVSAKFAVIYHILF